LKKKNFYCTRYITPERSFVKLTDTCTTIVMLSLFTTGVTGRT